jgi:hypothetical protein
VTNERNRVAPTPGTWESLRRLWSSVSFMVDF